MSDLPECGTYRTTRPLGEDISAGQLVYFHNHGDPGPGVYLPSRWVTNRAEWHETGHVIPSDEWAASLEPLPDEGLYRVTESFDCCERHCRTYETDLLVQLGYDADGRALLFVPEWTDAGIAIPEMGLAIDDDRLTRLAPLTVAEYDEEPVSDELH
jgi:hypothetical protein